MKSVSPIVIGILFVALSGCSSKKDGTKLIKEKAQSTLSLANTAPTEGDTKEIPENQLLEPEAVVRTEMVATIAPPPQEEIKKTPVTFRDHVELARVAMTSNDLKSARTYVDKALELAPDSSMAWNTLGRVELAEKNMDEAIEAFTEATDANPTNQYAWNNLGFTQLSEGLVADAVVSLEEATSLDSTKSYMWNNLGMAYEHLDDIELARTAYSFAMDRGSQKAELNHERLIGVISLKSDDDDIEHPRDIAMLEHDSATEDNSEF